MKTRLPLTLLLAFVCQFLFAQVSKTVNATAGELINLLTTTELTTVTDLTITGNIDARDFKTMRDKMSAVKNIDLSGASIVAYEGEGGTETEPSFFGSSYGANMIPIEAFVANATIKSIIIPDNVTFIDKYAFHGCINLETVKFPSALTEIEEKVFRYCDKLTEIDLSTGLTKKLGYACFEKCLGLTTVKLPSTLKYLSEQTFDGCQALETINIPASIISLPAYLFNNCFNLKTVKYEGTILSIGKCAFYRCKKLAIIELHEGLKTIGLEAFNECEAASNDIVIPNSVNFIGVMAFYRCYSIKSIILSNNLPSIPEDFALYSAIESQIIPEGIVSIGNSAFAVCKSLKTVEIPSTVKDIYTNAFNYCTGLESVTIHAKTPPDLSDNDSKDVFINVELSGVILYVPKGSKADYEKAVEWKDFGSIIEIETTSTNPTAPEITLSGTSFEIAETNLVNGAIVATITAKGDNLTFSLTGGDDMFTINSTTGVITIANAAGLEAINTVIDLTVKVSNGTESVTKNISVHLKNGNISPTTGITDAHVQTTVAINGKIIYLSGAVQNVQYTIISISGSIIGTGTLTDKETCLPGLAKGTYYLKYSAGNTSESIPFVVQ